MNAFPEATEIVQNYTNGSRRGYDVRSTAGMSLRDYFAAKAMQALLHPNVTGGALFDTYGTASVSEAAYLQADAMLEARGQ